MLKHQQKPRPILPKASSSRLTHPGSNQDAPGFGYASLNWASNAKASNPENAATDEYAGSVLGLGAGRRLGSRSRSIFDRAYSASFADVQIHTDGAADAIANRTNSRAFTYGNHVGFARGEYRPGSLVGDVLLAHELAHVKQQRDGGTFQASEGALERDANHAVGSVLGLKSTQPKVRSGLRLSRCDKHEAAQNEAEVAKELTPVEKLEGEKSRMEGTLASEDSSFGEKTSAIAQLRDIEHDLSVEKTGTGIYTGVRSPEAKAGNVPKGVEKTDYTTFVLEVLRKAFEAYGKSGQWAKVERIYTKNQRMRKGQTGLSGVDVQAALQSEAGWKGIYWAPDPKYQIPKEELSRAQSNEASYGANMAKTKGTYLKGYQNPDYPGVSVDHSVINYAPEAPRPGKGEVSDTVKDTSGLEKLAKIPFGVLTAHGGQHMTLLIYGKVYEAHWKTECSSPDVIDSGDLETWAIGSDSGYHYYASGVIVAPAEDVDKAFQ